MTLILQTRDARYYMIDGREYRVRMKYSEPTKVLHVHRRSPKGQFVPCSAKVAAAVTEAVELELAQG